MKVDEHERVWKHVAGVVRRKGIPQYVQNWRYATDDGPPVTSMYEVARRLREYHHHTFLSRPNGGMMPISPETDDDDDDGTTADDTKEIRSPSLLPPTLPLREKRTRRLSSREQDRLLRRPPVFELLYTDDEAKGKKGRGIGVMRLFTFAMSGLSKEASSERSFQLGRAIRAQFRTWRERDSIRGLILDLRKHSGGNFWPVLYGLSDLLVDVPLFAWVSEASVPPVSGPRSKKWLRIERIAEDEMYGTSTTTFDTSRRPPPRLAIDHFPVAVLVGDHTSSSGEIAAALFQGKSNVRSFGTPTSGELTVNEGYGVPHGYTLYLTVTLVATTDGRVEERIRPDVVTTRPLQASLKWMAHSSHRCVV